METIPNKNLPKAADTVPVMVKVEAGKTYAWCTCGLSEKQPFCDGTHKRIEPIINEAGESVLPFKSLKATFENDEEVWFCMCKQTKNPPFCDGSHKLLKTNTGTKEIWLNLPVKDVERSKEFFTALGFSFNEERTTPVSACMLVGEKKVVVMLFQQDVFKGFVKQELTDTTQSSEILISIDAQSRDDVDTLTKKAAAAGGKVFAEPAESQGWLYGSGFADIDGHRWNVLFMDMSKMPK